MITLTYPSGNSVAYTYDSAGRIASISFTPSGGSPVTVLDTLDYFPLGAPKAWTWGNGALYTRSFDTDGRLSQYPLGVSQAGTSAGVTPGALTRTVGYDLASRITGYTHTDTAGSSTSPAALAANQTFGFDVLDRITSYTPATTSQTYGYDANGNRNSQTIGANSYTYNVGGSSNRLTSTTGPSPAKSNTYDAAGNVTADGTSTWTYSDRGRMADNTNSGNTVSYLYNGLGQRVFKSGPSPIVPTGINRYVFDEAGRLLGEYDSSATPIEETIWLGDLPVAVIKPTGSTLSYVFPDQINTPRVIVQSADNDMLWDWSNADPFGMIVPVENPNSLGTYVYNPRFPGQVWDKESNLHYNYFRDYDPVVGRYWQSDPIGLQGGINTYTYVNGNPLRYIDPLGFEAGVTIWQPVGWGESSFGHVSTDINGTTWSFGPGGMTTMPTKDYRDKNSFRDGTEVKLKLTPEQEEKLKNCLSKPQGNYRATDNNCGTPVQSCLRELGFDTGVVLPVSLGNMLLELPVANGAASYPASKPAKGGSAPWAR